MVICKKCRKEIDAIWLHCPWCGSKQKQTKRKTTKRENGTGSVYKRSDLKHRPWVAATPAKGMKRPEIIGYFATAQEAKDALEAFRKNPTSKINITLKELYEEWKPIGLKDKSRQLKDSYRAAFNKLSEFHEMKFRELRTGHFQKIIDDLQKERPKLNKEGKPVLKDDKPVMLPPMSYSALHDIKVLAGLLYKYAMQNDVVHKNYAEFIVLPEQTKSVKPAFTDLQLRIVEKNIGTVDYADCIYFLCYTGLRITEFVRLNKFQVHKIGGNYALYGGIKTEAGENRIVPVHPKIKSILEAWMAKGGETVFCRPDGKPYTSKYFREECFYPALEKLGIQKNEKPYRLTPHATRRTFATMLSKAKVREEDFIAMMGHSDYSVDIESYIYQSAEKLQPVIEQLP